MKWPFGRKAPAAATPAAAESRAPDGMLVYAVGDIHGRSDLLDALLALIVEDAAVAGSGLRPTLVFLGDYVDRGPDSKGVIERLSQLGCTGGLAVESLRGNHEEALLGFLDDPLTGAGWAEYGGDATLRSYGVAAPRLRTDTAGWKAAREAFAEALPRAHVDWLSTLAPSSEIGDYLFVHAGVRPGVPLAQQTERDLLWIREPFLSWTGPHDRVIVHGHTPTEGAHLSPWRIGLDTGAYATGRLTALRLQGADRRLIQTGAR